MSTNRGAAAAAVAGIVISPGAAALQERLYELLNSLGACQKTVKDWPEETEEQGTTNTHVTQTSKLMSQIQAVLTSIADIEGTIQQDVALRSKLDECKIPMDLLDLLEAASINPSCFCRGLLSEALGQLAGLKRRKLALEMLGTAVKHGMSVRQQQKLKGDDTAGAAGAKRTLDDRNDEKPQKKEEEGSEEPATKKQRSS